MPHTDFHPDFHPATATWFERTFGSPTEPQAGAWPEIRAGRHTLIAAPTGSGKTLAAFLSAIDELVWQALSPEGLPDETRVVYVSPLKALSNDVEKNLEEPLGGIRRELASRGLPDAPIQTQVRTGDTPQSVRAAMVRRPPHILVTTPESLFILLTSESGRRMLSTVRTVIVDEIHAVADDKRGSHLSLSLERLEELRRGSQEGRLQRIGLSATQKPIEEVARFLVGAAQVAADGTPDCSIVDVGHARRLDLALEVPGSPLEAVMSAEVWSEVYDRLADLVRSHRTTLVFANTRRMAERVTRHLSDRLGDRLGEDRVTSHHGSLARDQRLEAERRLKAGELSALVATASLELGIDIGSVDLVCQLGSTRSIATFLQRVGRSGHHLGGLPKGRLFPITRDDLVECAALLDSVRRGELDRLIIPDKPLDVLAQQIVAAVAAEERTEDGLFSHLRQAWPYRELTREEFDETVEMLADGFTTRRGRRGAYLHRDAVNGRLRARKGARLAAITSGGAIPDVADYQVRLEPSGTVVGSVHEDFAVESLPGDVFQLGNTSWRILKIESGRVLVEDARGQPPSLPFWLGEAPGRTVELSAAVSRLREEVAGRLQQGAAATEEGHQKLDRAGCTAWLEEDLGLSASAAGQLVDYLATALAGLGAMPTQETLVAERFFDEAGDMHLVVHAPFGSRLNRGWGLALRKRFCQTFNFELQAAATEDAIVLSLGPTHSFPLEDVFRFLHSGTVKGVLTQALLDSPLFPVRWRWNASRALALPRFRGGRRVPAPLQRQEAEDLIAVVFPDQLACLENIAGEREIPDHPLVEQTLRDCLEEAMDIAGLEALLRRIEKGEIRQVARDLVEPSPLAQEILNSQPYSYLDDAPLEERRTRAVASRRWLDPETASDLGALDAAAISRVREEAWPDAASADELHDALLTLGLVTAEEGERSGWRGFLAELTAERRAGIFQGLWVAVERLPQLRALHPQGRMVPDLAVPPRYARDWTPDEAAVEVVRGRLSGLGPVTIETLAAQAGIRPRAAEAALLALEAEGFVLRGRFTPGRIDGETEWCERRLLARIHRYTLDRLRQEIEPVTQVDFLRFLLAWQRVDPDSRGEGPEALAALLEQLEGYEAAAAAWEGEILPARLKEYEPSWLDSLFLAGRYVWGRSVRSAPATSGRSARRSGPVRATPISFLSRRSLPLWREIARPANAADTGLDLSGTARAAYDYLVARGASFFGDIAHGAGLLHTQLEQALAELVSWGLVTADSFTGLRALLTPAHKRPKVGRPGLFGIENAGRWSLLGPVSTAAAPADPEPVPSDAPSEAALEAVAWVLLRRYGVIFRRLLERESLAPSWGELLRVLRRLEARGEIRGGRFVEGFSGEQYALAEAVGRLRAIRKQPRQGQLVSVSAADPLNLVGIVTPGEKLSALAGNRLLYRDGEPIAVQEGKEVRFLVDPDTLDPAARWQAQSALVRRNVPSATAPRLRAYLGRSA